MERKCIRKMQSVSYCFLKSQIINEALLGLWGMHPLHDVLQGWIRVFTTLKTLNKNLLPPTSELISHQSVSARRDKGIPPWLKIESVLPTRALNYTDRWALRIRSACFYFIWWSGKPSRCLYNYTHLQEHCNNRVIVCVNTEPHIGWIKKCIEQWSAKWCTWRLWI